MGKKRSKSSTSQKFVPPTAPEDIAIRYDEDTGCWHVFVLTARGYEEVSQQCSKEEADDVANYLARWKRGE